MSDDILDPLNTEWNRKANFLPGTGNALLLGVKHGIAYFTWTDLNKNVTYLQCDILILKKHFRVKGLGIENTNSLLDTLLAKKTKFLKYPFDFTKG